MADGRWPEVRFRAMGCQMAAWLDAPPQVAQAALSNVQPMMARFEQVFSRFLPTSELSHLNGCPQERVSASAELFEVVEQALNMAEITGGLFDPTLLDALETAGYDRDFASLTFVAPASSVSHQPLASARRRWRDIRLDRRARTISLPPDTRLDLGGIAKGWAAERVTRALGEYGAALVDAGGDLVAVGAPDGLPGWPVALAAPGSDEGDMLRMWLRDASAATSGVDRRRWQVNGRSMHHLIDPRTGQPALTDVVTATVIAPDVVQAEAWAKASLMLGAVEGSNMLAEQGDLAGALLSENGTLYYTSNMWRWINASW